VPLWSNFRYQFFILRFARCAKRIAHFSTILPPNMDRIVLMKNAPTWDDVHIVYFHRRKPPACLRSWIQLNFTGKPAVNGRDRLCVGDKCSHMPQRCLRPCRRLRPRYVGGIWEPGFMRICAIFTCFKTLRPQKRDFLVHETGFSLPHRYHFDAWSSCESKEPRFRLLELEGIAVIGNPI